MTCMHNVREFSSLKRLLGSVTLPDRAALADRYEIQGVVGVGGMAAVYRALDRKHNRTVAIKVLPSALSLAVGTDRFLREIAILAALQHPRILALYDSGSADGDGGGGDGGGCGGGRDAGAGLRRDVSLESFMS